VKQHHHSGTDTEFQPTLQIIAQSAEVTSQAENRSVYRWDAGDMGSGSSVCLDGGAAGAPPSERCLKASF
jgi:hypothetical protein